MTKSTPKVILLQKTQIWKNLKLRMEGGNHVNLLPLFRFNKDTYSDYLDALPLLKGSRSGGLWKRVKKIDSFRAMGGRRSRGASGSAGASPSHLNGYEKFYQIPPFSVSPNGRISQQEFEEQERLRIKEAEQRKRETERRLKKQELRDYRRKNKLCLECGEKLSFWDKLSGAQYCKRHRT